MATPAQPPIGSPARPRVVNVAAILLILSVVPLFVGSVRGASLDLEQSTNSFMIGVVYCVLAVVVLGSRNWARITVTVLTVLIGSGMLIAVVQGSLAAGLSRVEGRSRIFR